MGWVALPARPLRIACCRWGGGPRAAESRWHLAPGRERLATGHGLRCRGEEPPCGTRRARGATCGPSADLPAAVRNAARLPAPLPAASRGPGLQRPSGRVRAAHLGTHGRRAPAGTSVTAAHAAPPRRRGGSRRRLGNAACTGQEAHRRGPHSSTLRSGNKQRPVPINGAGERPRVPIAAAGPISGRSPGYTWCAAASGRMEFGSAQPRRRPVWSVQVPPLSLRPTAPGPQSSETGSPPPHAPLKSPWLQGSPSAASYRAYPRSDWPALPQRATIAFSGTEARTCGGCSAAA